MAFDVIVFNQEELERALAAGVRSIALCDNSFTLPDIDGIHYTIIGDVRIDGCDAPEYKEDKPSEEIPVYANVENKTLSLSSSFNGSYAGSFASSYGGGLLENGSFAGGSGGSMQGSYAYEYEYEFASSYGASFASSFASSYMSEYYSSYQTSFSSSFYSFISGMSFEFGSFGFGGSFGYGYSFEFGGSFGYEYFGSYAGSFNTGSGYMLGSGGSFNSPLPDIVEYGSSGIIFVNGYGINLI